MLDLSPLIRLGDQWLNQCTGIQKQQNITSIEWAKHDTLIKCCQDLNETLKKIGGVPNKSWAEEVQDLSEMADL